MIGLVSKTTVVKARQLGIDLSGGLPRGQRRRSRVVVFAEKFPGKHKSGFALRSRVVWWLHTGEIISGIEFDIHHRNENRIDDRFRNLKKMTHLEHSKLHNPKQPEVLCICIVCQDQFSLPQWFLNDSSKGRFCSLECYHNFPKSETTRKRVSKSLKLNYKRGYKSHRFGKKHTEQTRNKMSESHIGKKHTEQARNKMSESHKKRWAELQCK